MNVYLFIIIGHKFGIIIFILSKDYFIHVFFLFTLYLYITIKIYVHFTCDVICKYSFVMKKS